MQGIQNITYKEKKKHYDLYTKLLHLPFIKTNKYIMTVILLI